MSAFIGALLDVSGSMRESIGDGVDEEGGPWVQSIFQVINDLIKNDVASNNQMFATCFGGNPDVTDFNDIFDAIGAVNAKSTEQANEATINSVLNILKSNGAVNICRWAKTKTVCKTVSKAYAQIVLDRLTSDKVFLYRVIFQYLPKVCLAQEQRGRGTKSYLSRDDFNQVDQYMRLDYLHFRWPMNLNEALILVIYYALQFLCWVKRGISMVVKPVNVGAGSMASVGECGTAFVRPASVEDIEDVVKKISADIDVYPVKKAADIIRGNVGVNKLTKDRAKELLRKVEPYIYGSTPLHEALQTALRKMSDPRYRRHNLYKMLFVLSDGMATDRGDMNIIKAGLEEEKVKVVCCYINRSSAVEPKRLYSVADIRWEKGAQFMFKLSSTIPTELVTRAILIKQGWDIDIENNETRLFMFVNHPKHLKEACSLARNVVCNHDALSELLVSVDLDIYINQKNSSIQAKLQDGPTCYANACATVLHLAMHRILGRDGGYPDFEELRKEMIEKYASNRANTWKVIQYFCRRYRLQCKRVTDVKEAMKAIIEKRPVVARFKLTNADVLNLEFYDVFWTTDDLSEGEKQYYEEHGAEVARKLVKSLKALQVATYTCPVCNESSNIARFTGTLSHATCPKNECNFNAQDGKGNILALNVYLTSLSSAASTETHLEEVEDLGLVPDDGSYKMASFVDVLRRMLLIFVFLLFIMIGFAVLVMLFLMLILMYTDDLVLIYFFFFLYYIGI